MNNEHRRAAVPLALSALIALGLACNLPGARSEVPTPTPTLNLETLLPPATETPTPPGPTPTLEPGVTPTATVCTWAAIWVEDVTYPDGAEVEAGTKFDKTWRIRNNGCLDWPDGTVLAFIDEDKMGGPDTASVGRVSVGGTKDITVTLTAPAEEGEHRGLWRLRTADGLFFGQVVWVQIDVTPAPTATATPTEVAEEEETLTPVASESGSLTETAPGTTTPSTTVQVGVSTTGKRVRGFVSFDISDISGEVTRARLDLSNFTDNSQFGFLKPLLVEQLAYGASFDAADFDAAGALLLSASSSADLDDEIDITDQVAAVVAGGGSRYQIRLRFQQDSAANAALAGTMGWSNVRLIVEYQPE